MRILLVDDDPDILEVLSVAIQTFGFQDVERAQSGARALEMMDNALQPFDLFLLDIQMPEMTGIELCRHIRSRSEYTYTPVIMVTALSDRQHIDQAFAFGATDYVSKPVDFMDLKLRIKLAEKASYQEQQMAQLAPCNSVSCGTSETAPTIALSDAVPIDEVDGVVRVHAFENYLRQMGRFEFSATRLLVLSVRNIDKIYAKCTSREFLNQVTDIAESISDGFSPCAPLIAYFGRGIYGIAVPAKHSIPIPTITNDIHRQAALLDLVFHDGCPVTLEIDIADIGMRPFFSPKTQSGFVERLMQELKSAAHSASPLIQGS